MDKTLSLRANVTIQAPHGSSRLLSTLVITLLFTLLTSCSHVRRDGPPNYYVDETKIPNAVPKPEALAKYGNMKAYNVAGKRYHVMKSSKHYSAVGVASWYGTMFHSRKTSSGERYDMLAMTAAHKSLPLPTYVQVTNLKNHRQIIVKVNDRGPFKENRIIDLSYVAAKKLGMLGRGTANVRVTAINPYTFGKNSLLASKKAHNGRLYLETAAVRSRTHAENIRQRIDDALQAPVKISSSSNRHKLYRVQIGPFKDVADANRTLSQLRTLGINANKIREI